MRTYEVAVVGGGPAGLSAGMWLGRYLHRAVVIDSGDPRNWETRAINGYLGQPRVRPAELRASGRDECRKYDVDLVDAIVVRATKRDDDMFELSLANGTVVTAQRLLLAIGIRDVWPRIPGIREVYGANAHVCPDCDGYACRGLKVAVIGTGRRAVGMALNLTTWTRDIVICTNGEDPALDDAEYCDKLDALNIPVLTAPIRSLVSGDAGDIRSLCLDGGMQLDVDKVFFTIGQYAADDLGVQLGCARDDDGHILVDEHCHTSVMNVFAAGDIIPGPQLAIAAAADGAIAALAIHKSLVPDDRKLSKISD